MKKKLFLKDKLYSMILFLVFYCLFLLLLFAFKINFSLIITLSILLFTFFSATLMIDYYRKNTFYTNLLANIEALDKAYLVLETLEKPNFYDGELLYQALYDINKSMNEYVKTIQIQVENFKEYIEMWIHEVKIPIASLILMAHNHKKLLDKNSLE